MKASKWFVSVAAALAVTGVLALADDGATSQTTGLDNAIAKIQAATTQHVDVLTALLSKVPEKAQAGIQRAIAAAQKGHDTALAALARNEARTPARMEADDNQSTENESAEAGGRPSVMTGSDDTGQGGKPDTTGLARARDAVSSAFQKSVTTLQGLIGKLPEQAAASVQEALARVQESRAVALQNLDRLISGQRPERAAATDRPAPPDHPDRADRPERPERPEIPDRPQPPARPERPEPPAHP